MMDDDNKLTGAIKGIVTEIQRFSLQDGPGIRTTVFLKGCNMHCSWCHNPETLKHMPEIMFYPIRCIGCGKCVEVCPQGAHSIANGVHTIDRDVCVGCGKCAEACYAEALQKCGTRMSAKQIMDEVVQDKPYYDNSNGGMTISGGECLCQSAFVEQLIDAAHERGIHAAIETNLSFDFARIEDVLRKCDLVMFDIKLMDDEMHKKYTGVSNAKVLENAKRLDELGIPFIVRTPLIPGVTDTDENVAAIADYIKDMKHLVRYELLNFNTLGGAKYESLAAENAHADARPLNKARLDELSAIVAHAGIQGKVG